MSIINTLTALMTSSSQSGFSLSDSSFYEPSHKKAPANWEKNGGFLLYLALMFYVFAGFELVCDIYFVPALNVFCEVLHLSEDFAGAILMGIGSNLPDVFSATVGVCIIDTDVGTGSIVGSSLFNLLFIIGTCLCVVKKIKLSLKYLVREAGFYFVSIVLFIVSLYDGKVTIYESGAMITLYVIYVVVCAFTPQIMRLIDKIRGKKSGGYVKVYDGKDDGIINSTASGYLFTDEEACTSLKDIASIHTESSYTAPRIPNTNNFTPSPSAPATSESTSVGGKPQKTNTFARLALFSKEIEKGNSNANPPMFPPPTTESKSAFVDYTPPQSEGSSRESSPNGVPIAMTSPGEVETISSANYSSNGFTSLNGMVDDDDALEKDEEEVEKEKERIKKEGRARIKESHINAFHKIMEAMKEKGGNNGGENGEGDDSGKSLMESGLDVGLPYGEVQMHGFLYKKSRWYTKINISSQIWQKRWFVLSDSFWYCRNPLNPEKGRREIPLWRVWNIEIDSADKCVVKIFTRKETYELRAVTPQVAAKWARALKERLDSVKEVLPQYYSDSGLMYVDDEDDEGDYVSTLEYPFDESTGHILFWALTYPLALLLAITVPDVRKEKHKKFFVLTFIMVCIWIGAMSYAMVWAADNFAHVVGISDDIMGLTITAFGSSLPSLFGSVIAAKQGTADMAVSNAFGSSLTALISIGIPCFVFSAFVHPGDAYPCESGAILVTNFLLIISLIFFLIFAAMNKLRLNVAHGIILIISYFVFLAMIVLCQVFNISFKKN